MEEFKLYGICNHRVQEILSIAGTSPSFTADLKYTSNGNRDLVSILNLVEYDGLCLFGVDVPGITNWSFSADKKQVQFGTLYPVDAGMEFPNPDSSYIPANVYFCTYTTALDSCPKCNGIKYDFDMHFDNAGRVIVVQGHEKIRQQLVKALLTVRGSNLFDSDYGSVLSETIGNKIDSYLAARIQFSILECLNHLIDIQNNQGLPDDERIVSISDVTATRSATEPRTIEITATVMCADYQEVNTSLTVKV
jgi:hypothetical protein